MKLWLNILLYSLMLVSTSLNASDYSDGKVAIEKKNYIDGYKLFNHGCEENKDSKSCFELGKLYEAGLGTRKNILLARESFDKSCQLGNKKGCKEFKRVDLLMPACSLEQLAFLEDERFFKIGQKDGFPLIVADANTIEIDKKKKIIKVWIYWIANKKKQKDFLKDFGKKYKQFGYFKRQMAIDYKKSKYKAIRVDDIDVEGTTIMSFDFKGAAWKKIKKGGIIEAVSKKIQKNFLKK